MNHPAITLDHAEAAIVKEAVDIFLCQSRLDKDLDENHRFKDGTEGATARFLYSRITNYLDGIEKEKKARHAGDA